MLGASPGASVTVSIMLELIERCFPEQTKGAWAAKLKEIFPAREKVLATDAALYHKISAHNDEVLGLVESSPAQSYA
ncbi:Malate:quinone oxidoreductase [compost metagenome]